MSLKIYNTLTRTKEEFVPVEPGKVTIYLCGPTVYDYIHVGNARPFIMYDIFRRYLEYKGFQVKLVVNLTDIDDHIIEKSIKEKISARQVSEKYTSAFFEDTRRLGIKPASINPKATENVDGIIALITTLIEKGMAYSINGDVFYRIGKFKDYGKLSGKNIDELQSGARVEVDKRKENPLDFALWKSAKEGEPFWESPWGNGRPGWHIECSVMSMKYLGETIDIHAGGSDLIFPHHENEIAQSEGATGKPFVRYWMHNGFLNIEGEKMSKSLGNFFTAREVLAKYDASAIRMFFLLKHYRSPINFSEERILEAQQALKRIMTTLEAINRVLKGHAFDKEVTRSGQLDIVEELRKDFLIEMDDDFNTAGAMSKIFELVKEANLILVKTDLTDEELRSLWKIKIIIEEFDVFLGILTVKNTTQSSNIEASLIELLIETRKKTREARLWDLADHIRNRLNDIGIELMDRPDRTTWRKK
ncbi:MAG: cysteine--tRNA ligase [Candidatus Zhuqueibacterota bacterium]